MGTWFLYLKYWYTIPLYLYNQLEPSLLHSPIMILWQHVVDYILHTLYLSVLNYLLSPHLPVKVPPLDNPHLVKLLLPHNSLKLFGLTDNLHLNVFFY